MIYIFSDYNDSDENEEDNDEMDTDEAAAAAPTQDDSALTFSGHRDSSGEGNIKNVCV